MSVLCSLTKQYICTRGWVFICFCFWYLFSGILIFSYFQLNTLGTKQENEANISSGVSLGRVRCFAPPLWRDFRRQYVPWHRLLLYFCCTFAVLLIQQKEQRHQMKFKGIRIQANMNKYVQRTISLRNSLSEDITVTRSLAWDRSGLGLCMWKNILRIYSKYLK